jgi:hypothetical protein
MLITNISMKNDNLKDIRKYLSDEQVIIFLKKINKSYNDILAVKLINEELNNNSILDDIFLLDEEGYGYFLNADEKSDNKFKLSFGCYAYHLAGDGGIWDVEFLNDDCKVNLISEWIS